MKDTLVASWRVVSRLPDRVPACHNKKEMPTTMWCDRCQSDVPADANATTGQLRCGSCGASLFDDSRKSGENRPPEGNKDFQAIREARAILERWQNSDLLDRIQATEEIPPLVWSTDPARRTRPAAGSEQETRRRGETPQKWMPPRVNVDGTALPPSLEGMRTDRQPTIKMPLPENRSVETPPQDETTQDAVQELPGEVDVTSLSFNRTPSETAAIDPALTFPPGPAATELPDTLDLPDTLEQPAIVAETLQNTISSTAAGQVESTRVTDENVEMSVPTESSAPMPTKTIKRQPLRRPAMQRRTAPPTSAQVSSSGPVNVNRKLRVDHPGGRSDELNTIDEQSVAAENAPVTSSVAPETAIVTNSRNEKTSRRMRIDGPEPLEKLSETGSPRLRTQGKPTRRYIDDPHGAQPRGPHFQVSTPRRSNLTAMTGQFLAYLGVLGLTIGTAIVIYGTYSGYSDYTPTGWLVTTVAQMLLFLGVINLVSGGIEQNNEDVSRRINTLGEQLVRIEQVTEEVLRGPRISPRLYANPELENETQRSREELSVE